MILLEAVGNFLQEFTSNCIKFVYRNFGSVRRRSLIAGVAVIALLFWFFIPWQAEQLDNHHETSKNSEYEHHLKTTDQSFHPSMSPENATERVGHVVRHHAKARQTKSVNKVPRVAFLVIEDSDSNAIPYLNSLRKALNGASRLRHAGDGSYVTKSSKKPTLVTPNYFMFVRNTRMYGADDVTFIESFLFDGEANPCRAYVILSPRYGYFYDSNFDYVFMADPRIRIFAEDFDFTEIEGERVAVIHPSFHAVKTPLHLPYDRRPDSCAYVAPGDEKNAGRYFAGNFFGGKPSEMMKFCEATLKCEYWKKPRVEWPQFHQIFNRFLRDPELAPTRILNSSYTYAKKISDLPFEPRITLDERSLTPYLRVIGFSEDIFEQRLQRLELVMKSIKQNYIDKITTRLNDPSDKLQYLSYRCDVGMLCGGFGDRLRGIASLFYLAIAMQRAFVIDWLKPVDLGRYFQVNHVMYGLPATKFALKIAQHVRVNSSTWIWATDNEGANFTQSINRSNFSAQFSRTDLVQVTTNRGYTLIDLLLRNDAFHPILRQTIADMPEYLINVDHSVLLSASLRLSLGQLTEKTEKLLNDTLIAPIGQEKWAKAKKIGIQIRSCLEKWGENCQRVKPEQWHCFAAKAIELIEKTIPRRQRRKGIFVFVTSDIGKNVTDKVSEIITRFNANIKVIGTSSLPLNHVDISQPTSDDREVAWHDMARPMIDWHLLTQMDYLIISRSSFGETASVYSLKPTFRFKHWKEKTCEFVWYNLNIYKHDAL